MQQQLQQNDAEMQKKEQEKQAVSKEIKGIENELHNLNNTIAKIKRMVLFNVKSMKHISRLSKSKKLSFWRIKSLLVKIL